MRPTPRNRYRTSASIIGLITCMILCMDAAATPRAGRSERREALSPLSESTKRNLQSQTTRPRVTGSRIARTAVGIVGGSLLALIAGTALAPVLAPDAYRQWKEYHATPLSQRPLLPSIPAK